MLWALLRAWECSLLRHLLGRFGLGEASIVKEGKRSWRPPKGKDIRLAWITPPSQCLAHKQMPHVARHRSHSRNPYALLRRVGFTCFDSPPSLPANRTGRSPGAKQTHATSSSHPMPCGQVHPCGLCGTLGMVCCSAACTFAVLCEV